VITDHTNPSRTPQETLKSALGDGRVDIETSERGLLAAEAGRLIADASGEPISRVASLGSIIATAAYSNPCDGHTPAEVVRAAFASAANFLPAGCGRGRVRSTVESLIRKASENGELPEVWQRAGEKPARVSVEGW